MARKNTKEKKLRRKENRKEELERNSVILDVPRMISESPLDTKPEVGDFLKKYVKSIRIFVDNSKIMVYPVTKYSINRVFVDFLDGHQLIAVLTRSPNEYYLYMGVDEVEITEDERKSIVVFIQKLQEFGFVR